VTFNHVWSSFACLSTNIIALVNYHTETLDFVRLPTHRDNHFEEESVFEPGRTQIKPRFTMLLRLNLPERTIPGVDTLNHLYVSATPISSPDVSRPFADHSKHVPFIPSPNAGLVRVNMRVRKSKTQADPLDCGFFVHRESLLSLLGHANYSEAVKEAKPGPLHPPIQEQNYVRNFGDSLLCGPNVLDWDVWVRM
jgi:hypothetical protein